MDAKEKLLLSQLESIEETLADIGMLLEQVWFAPGTPGAPSEYGSN